MWVLWPLDVFPPRVVRPLGRVSGTPASVGRSQLFGIGYMPSIRRHTSFRYTVHPYIPWRTRNTTHGPSSQILGTRILAYLRTFVWILFQMLWCFAQGLGRQRYGSWRTCIWDLAAEWFTLYEERYYLLGWKSQHASLVRFCFDVRYSKSWRNRYWNSLLGLNMYLIKDIFVWPLGLNMNPRVHFPASKTQCVESCFMVKTNVL